MTVERDSVGALRQSVAGVGSQGLDSINKLVQQGPAGVSVLSFFGGIATMVVGIDGLIHCTTDITGPFDLLLDIYLVLFGITSILLESDINGLKKTPLLKTLVPRIAKGQAVVHEYAQFLTKLQGRGMFYIFIGTLTIIQCIPLTCLKFWIGAWNLFVGVLCIMMSFGIKPDLVSKRSSAILQRETMEGGYVALSQPR